MNTSTVQDMKQNNHDEMVKRLRVVLPELLRGTPINLVYLYGSVARDAPTPLSDVDIAIVVSDDADAFHRLSLEAHLGASLAKCGIPGTDVRIINDAPIMLKGVVVTEGILVYAADEVFRIEFETRARIQYFDYLPAARQMQDEYIEAVLTRQERTSKVPT
jgi:predicted nucleotidyltransferase